MAMRAPTDSNPGPPPRPAPEPHPAPPPPPPPPQSFPSELPSGFYTSPVPHYANPDPSSPSGYVPGSPADVAYTNTAGPTGAAVNVPDPSSTSGYSTVQGTPGQGDFLVNGLHVGGTAYNDPTSASPNDASGTAADTAAPPPAAGIPRTVWYVLGALALLLIFLRRK